MAENGLMTSVQTTHNLMINRLAAKQAKGVDPYLRSVADYVNKRLAESGEYITSAKELKAIVKDTKAYMLAEFGAWDDELIGDLTDFANYEAEFQAKTLEKFVPNYESETPSSAKLMKEATTSTMVLNGKETTLSKTLSVWTPNQISNVNTAIYNGWKDGANTSEISKSVNSILKTTSKNESDSIVLTATNHIGATSRQETYKENDDLVIGYRLIATLDTRTTATCAHFDQMVVKWADDYQPINPFHYRCRTVNVPELDGRFDQLKEGATRASNFDGGKSVSATTSYYDQLKQQPAYVQDQALGKERGLVFRNAGLSTDEFKRAMTTRMGQPLTLKEMAHKDSRIAEYLDK